MDGTASIPVLYVRASNNYDIGFSIGKTFKGWIKEYIDGSTDINGFRKFYETSRGKQVVDGYFATGQKCCPKIMSEIKGMADGAQVKFEDLFLLQLASEIFFCHMHETTEREDDPELDSMGCTDLLVNTKNCRVMAHNEDWSSSVTARAYIVHVTITNDNDDIEEQFVSYCFPGYLAGLCFGMNRSLVFTLNSLKPKYAVETGVPLSILLRSLLACTSIKECASVMENKPTGCAFGMNINIASIDGEDMCSMEVYPTKSKTEVNVMYVPLGDGNDDDSSFYAHQNHYKRISNAVEMGACTGSKLRDKRILEIGIPKTVDDMKTILGDTKGDKEPIYRTPNDGHIAPKVQTTATAVFDITNRCLHVYRTNPKLSKSPCVTLPFF